MVGAAWDARLDAGLLVDVNRYRKYDTASVRDCLRILRNKRHHFHELPEAVQRVLAPLPGGRRAGGCVHERRGRGAGRRRVDALTQRGHPFACVACSFQSNIPGAIL